MNGSHWKAWRYGEGEVNGRPRLHFCGHKHPTREKAEACAYRWQADGIVCVGPGETGLQAWRERGGPGGGPNTRGGPT